MKQIKTLAALLFSLLVLTNCGGNKKEKIHLPDPPTDIVYEGVESIDGPLSEYIEVVPGGYKLELEKDEDGFSPGYKTKLKVKFKFLKPIDVEAGMGYNYYGPSLLGKALDEQGAPLGFSLNINTDKDLATYLSRGSGEEWLTARVSGQGSIWSEDDAKKQLEMYKKGVQIRFNSEIVEEKIDGGSSSNNTIDDNSSSTNSSNGDCDEFLKGYEKFMDDYLVVLKKISNNPNDMTAMAKYTSMMMEANEWAGKTGDCASNPKYAGKLTEIQMKIANAASGM